MGASITLPVVGDPGSAEITGPTIDHEELAMRAEIHGYIDEAKNFELYPGLSHQLHSAAMNAIAAQGVLEKVHFYSGPSAFRQRFGKCIRHFAFSKEEVLERDCPLRRTNRFEQSRENLIAIFQRGHFVAFQQGWAEQISHRSDEDLVPDHVVSDNFVVDLLLGGEEIAGDKERRRSAKGGCTKRRWPSCL